MMDPDVGCNMAGVDPYGMALSMKPGMVMLVFGGITTGLMAADLTIPSLLLLRANSFPLSVRLPKAKYHGLCRSACLRNFSP